MRLKSILLSILLAASYVDASAASADYNIRFNVYLTDQADVKTFVQVRDGLMGDHKPGATLLVIRGLARPELKIEIEAVAAKVD